MARQEARVRFCKLCYAPLLENGHISRGAKEAECASICDNAESILRLYCDILEKNPRAFDYLNDYVIK